MDMEMWKYFGITHTDHTLMDPMSLAKTEQLIEKLKLMKQGLLHDLLTRGIDDNGELRDPERHAEQFKDSPLGTIPAAWTVDVLGALTDIAGGVTLGRHLDGPGTIELPYLRVANVQDGYIDTTEMKAVRIFRTELPRFALEPEDVLMTEVYADGGSAWRN